MSDDIAFKIQLGVILPKLKKTAKEGFTTIIQDHIDLLKEGTLEGEERASQEDVKALIMQSLEIFLDSEVLPPIYEKFNPPVVEVEESGSVVEEAA